MRIVTYSRVSSLGQETEGESLQNQDRAFTKALERNPTWIRVKHYRETASAKTVAGRAKFSAMLDELPDTKPDMILVDTLDRFTRNLREGLNLLEEFRGKHVRLLPLDWRRTEPINLDDDRDWNDVVGEFQAAERENRIRSRRTRRSWEGRRERGAVLTNRTPFGLRREGDRLVPGEHAWIITEIDRRYLAGDRVTKICEWVSAQIGDKYWGSRTGIILALRSQHYVDAGLRTPETREALLAALDARRIRHGKKSVHEHEFTGVFACARCLALGYAPAEALMTGQMTHDNKGAPHFSLVCQDGNAVRVRHPRFIVRVERVRPMWNAAVELLQYDEPTVIRWQRAGAGNSAAEARRALLRRLGTLDGDAARLKARRDRAFDLLGEDDALIVAQARKMLTDGALDENALAVKAEALRAQLATLEAAEKPRDAQTLLALVSTYRETYAALTPRRQNLLNRALCAALGSHPIVDRTADHRWARVTMEWADVLRAQPPSAAQRRV